MKKRHILIFLGVFLLFMTFTGCQSSGVRTTLPFTVPPGGSTTQPSSTTQSQQTLVVDNLNTVLKSGIPVLAEFGRGTCIPCKQMKPILENLAVEYKGKLYVAIISVDDYYDLTVKSGIMAIPTQIFYDGSGKEVARHIGFYAKEGIVTQLKKMGIE
jgi:thioredoxin 1